MSRENGTAIGSAEGRQWFAAILSECRQASLGLPVIGGAQLLREIGQPLVEDDHPLPGFLMGRRGRSQVGPERLGAAVGAAAELAALVMALRPPNGHAVVGHGRWLPWSAAAVDSDQVSLPVAERLDFTAGPIWTVGREDDPASRRLSRLSATRQDRASPEQLPR